MSRVAFASEIAAGRASAKESVRGTLARIRERNASINAYRETFDELAEARADAIDRAAGRRAAPHAWGSDVGDTIKEKETA